MNPTDIAVLALATPALLTAGPLALRMAKEKREGAAVLRMLAQERAQREQETGSPTPPDGGEPLPADAPAAASASEYLAPVIPLRAAA